MECIDVNTLVDTALDFLSSSDETPELSNIWRYMVITLYYHIHTIIICQSAYPPYMLPKMASAFSQINGTSDTPSTSVFGAHFDNKERAIKMIRNTWSLLKHGYMFVNADYMPRDSSSESHTIDSVIRINLVVEFLCYNILSKPIVPKKITILCLGMSATYCGSSVSRRLRCKNIDVKQHSCKQPSYLAKSQYNRHLIVIGKDSRYMFCKSTVLRKFTDMVCIDTCLDDTKASLVLPNQRTFMTKGAFQPMTKMALQNIAAEVQSIAQKLDTSTKKMETISDVNLHKDDVMGILRDTVKCLGDLVNLVMADAYTYKVVTEGESLQIPVAFREQHAKGISDAAVESQSIDGSTITGLTGIKSATPDRNKAHTYASKLFKTKAKKVLVAKTPDDEVILPSPEDLKSKSDVPKLTAEFNNAVQSKISSKSQSKNLFKTPAGKPRKSVDKIKVCNDVLSLL
jgi:hypothetical protein